MLRYYTANETAILHVLASNNAYKYAAPPGTMNVSI